MENGVRADATGVNALLDYIRDRHDIRSDAELARELGCRPPVISKMRHGWLPFGAAYILAIHEVFDMPIKEIKERLRAS